MTNHKLLSLNIDVNGEHPSKMSDWDKKDHPTGGNPNFPQHISTKEGISERKKGKGKNKY